MKVFIGISLFLFSLGLSISSNCSSHSEKTNASAVSESVKNYVELSSKGEFDKLAGLIDTESQTKVYESNRPDSLSQRKEVLDEQDRELIGKEFPEFIFKNKFKINKFQEERVDATHAKATVIFENENGIAAIAWVFSLVRSDKGGDWKIYDIVTLGQDRAR